MSYLDPEPADRPRGIRVAEQTIVFANEPLPSVVLFDDESDSPTVAWSPEDGADDLRAQLRAAKSKARVEQRQRRAERSAKQPITRARPPARGWGAVRFLALFCAVVGVGAALGFVAMDQAQHRVQLPESATDSLGGDATPPLWSESPFERSLVELGLGS